VSRSRFADLATTPRPALDELALALTAEFQPVDADRARATLEGLAAEVASGGDPGDEIAALVDVLARRHGFAGDTQQYDDPDNSMLDVVLERRRGLPILLSVVYVEVARRAGIAFAPFGLPGHFVCGHAGADPPLLVDPFNRGAPVLGEVSPALLRPWGPHETAMRMLNNVVSSFTRRGDVGRALRGAELRLTLPSDDAARARNEFELRALRARLN
jgi:regulator of sirC expression with transglutaminase-like and TPR domain